MALKDRGDRTAWLAVLEGMALALLRERFAALDTAGKKALADEISQNVTAACAEINALAPTSSWRGKLSPAAAKATAARIAGSADYLCKEFLDELTPAPAPAQPSSTVPADKT